MEQRDWQGVFPAITTPFGDGSGRRSSRGSAKHVALADRLGLPRHRRARVARRSGDAALRREDQHSRNVRNARSATDVPLVAGIAGLSTAECVALAERAAAVGCDGLMVLPPYVYRGDWRETQGALRRGHRRDDAVVHALQQPDRVRHRRLAGADERAVGARESARREGIERRRAPCHGDPRDARRPARRSSPAWTT